MHSTPDGFESVFEDGQPALRQPRPGEWFLSAVSASIVRCEEDAEGMGERWIVRKTEDDNAGTE